MGCNTKKWHIWAHCVFVLAHGPGSQLAQSAVTKMSSDALVGVWATCALKCSLPMCNRRVGSESANGDPHLTYLPHSFICYSLLSDKPNRKLGGMKWSIQIFSDISCTAHTGASLTTWFNTRVPERHHKITSPIVEG